MINYSKGKTKFWFSLLVMVILVIYLLREKIYKFKAHDKNANFPTQFCLGNISEKI